MILRFANFNGVREKLNTITYYDKERLDNLAKKSCTHVNAVKSTGCLSDALDGKCTGRTSNNREVTLDIVSL